MVATPLRPWQPGPRPVGQPVHHRRSGRGDAVEDHRRRHLGGHARPGTCRHRRLGGTVRHPDRLQRRAHRDLLRQTGADVALREHSAPWRRRARQEPRHHRRTE